MLNYLGYLSNTDSFISIYLMDVATALRETRWLPSWREKIIYRQPLKAFNVIAKFVKYN